MNQSSPPIGDRRPIATRERAWSKALAAVLVRYGLSANAISVIGMIAGCLAGVAFAATLWVERSPTERVAWLVGAVFVQFRLLANMLDGMVAIASGTTSRLGELYNEIPDRVSDAATLIGLGLAVQSSLVLGCLAACVAMFVAYVRAVGKVAGAHQEFCGPFAKPHRMFLVTLLGIYMALTPDAWQPDLFVTRAWGSWGLPAAVLLLIIVGGMFTAARRLVRIARALQGEPTS